MARLVATSEADVVDAVRAARERKSTLEIVGAGTKRALGRPVETSDVLDLSALSGIVSYEPSELILTVKAATPIAEIEQALKEQRLGFDPSDWGPLLGAAPNAGTIGGAISTDLCSSAAVQYGRVRNHLLGFHGVNGLGEAYKAGGNVVKNVTGFDLPKLMCGAFGTLGVLTEVTLRVFPKPEFSLGVLVQDVSPDEGLAVLRQVWSSPLEATGLVYFSRDAASSLPGQRPACALIRLEGSKDTLADKRSALRALLAGHNFEEIGDSDWVLSMFGSGVAFANSALDVWRIILPPSQCTSLVNALRPSLWYADWAGGLLWTGFEHSDNGIHQIAAQYDGQATLVRASEQTRTRVSPFPPQDEIRASLTRTVKAAFDPLQLFNPGRMVEGV